jgi:hypothetical protein
MFRCWPLEKQLSQVNTRALLLEEGLVEILGGDFSALAKLFS